MPKMKVDYIAILKRFPDGANWGDIGIAMGLHASSGYRLGNLIAKGKEINDTTVVSLARALTNLSGNDVTLDDIRPNQDAAAK